MGATTLLDIEDALFARLQLLAASEPEVAWPGTVYEPKPGTPYLLPRIQGRSRAQGGIGPNTPAMWTGSLTLVVCHPAAEGRRRATVRAGRILDHFPRGLSLFQGAARVTLEAATIEPEQASTDWVEVPVVVRWFSEER